MKRKTLLPIALQAHKIVKNLVRRMSVTSRFPPAALLDSDALDDTVGDTYVHIYPLLRHYDPVRASLMTYLYLPVLHSAPRIAWQQVKGGITGTGRNNTALYLESYPTDYELELPDDEDSLLDADGNTSSRDPIEFAAYQTPPELLETPGSDEHMLRERRAARIRQCRELLRTLPYLQKVQMLRYLDADGDLPQRRRKESRKPWYIIRTLRNRLLTSGCKLSAKSA